MANSMCDVPDDWWGLTKKEVEHILRQYRPVAGARLTNEKHEYRGSHEDFQITDVGKFRIVAKSKKGLRRALTAIHDYVRTKPRIPKTVYPALWAGWSVDDPA